MIVGRYIHCNGALVAMSERLAFAFHKRHSLQAYVAVAMKC